MNTFEWPSWPNFQIVLQRPACRQRQGHGSLFAAFAVAKSDRANTLAEKQIMQFQIHEIADSAAGVQQQV